ncbi:MAG: RNA-binding protein [Nitrososphaeria archaeon]|nr:RNA-binding protein [Nitrososphaeria archaeon]NDB51736.1 RNA-binding protein [Nitrosopumilaceae archaeon]NDB90206.1 RNA-binding protein [Nitrososphaerota archaeon]NDB46723.1 RNA-binding protein [Nitrososphaeria archaeon]NDB63339.1 RNA-binding protein [Nitrosopumilaceae archaeon]
MKSNLISKSETSEVLAQVAAQWKVEIPKIKNLKIYEFEDGQIIVGEGLTAIKIGENYLPFLSDSVTLAKFPSVMVDMGAVKFMCNGANVMRPGIRSFGEFEKGQIVCIIEESQKKSLAVGRALVSSQEMAQMSKGIVIENLHYISDKYWEAKKTIKD